MPLRPGQYDPHQFPDTGPDELALGLQRKGAPGAPAKAGTCVWQVKVQVFESLRVCRYRAETSLCGKGWSWHDGAEPRPVYNEPAQKAAEHDGYVHFANHICDR